MFYNFTNTSVLILSFYWIIAEIKAPKPHYVYEVILSSMKISTLIGKTTFIFSALNAFQNSDIKVCHWQLHYLIPILGKKHLCVFFNKKKKFVFSLFSNISIKIVQGIEWSWDLGVVI